ncbi:hypothetical protein [Leptolyngbya sp. PCC 6406]|uniref:hypothetical protein n=1 Tax=Leptolyngbya sp. PCC 6406 TaxID=1173264 RepID=UPI0002ABA12D|nr:hypothetical protein [Leptolyngbya sp. PCC 6406]
MPQKVLILDTSILCVWLNIPGKESCGPDSDRWNLSRLKPYLEQAIAAGATLVLPLASIIETGNHIAQLRPRRRDLALALANIMKQAADETTPWAAFTSQKDLWDAAGLKQIADEWPDLVVQGVSLGDAAIKSVADHYVRLGYEVEILTGDSGLKALEPLPSQEFRRRRRRQRQEEH